VKTRTTCCTKSWSDDAYGKISVARGSDGLNIEISGSGPMTAKTMKLTHPGSRCGGYS